MVRAILLAVLLSGSGVVNAEVMRSWGVGKGSIDTTKIGSGSIDTTKLALDAVTSASILDGTIASNNLANGSVETAKIIPGGADTTRIGLRAVSNEKIVDGAVDTNKIASGAIDTTKILLGIINTDYLVDSAVDTAKLKAGAVTSTKLTDGAVDTAKLALGAVDTDRLGLRAISNEKIVDGAVDTNKLATDAVTAAKIIAGAVDTNRLASDAVTTVKILDANVTTAKIAPGAVDTSKLGSGSVDSTKLIAGITLPGGGIAAGSFGVNTSGLPQSTLDVNGQTTIRGAETVVGSGTFTTNLGVGVSVGGGARQFTVGGAANANTYMELATDSKQWDIGIGNGNGDDHLIFSDYTGYTIMDWDRSGNLRIGNNSPTLNVNSGTNHPIFVSSATQITFYENSVGASTITAAGFFIPAKYTKAQVDTLVPSLGAMIIVTDTTIPYSVCVGTGTLAAQWRAADSATKGCGTDN